MATTRALSRIRRVVYGGYATLGIGLAAGAYFDEGFRRSLIFWGQAFPIYLHYEYVHQTTKTKSDQEINDAFEKLHNFYSPIAKRITLQLRGFYLKTAQLASTVTSTLPPQYQEWCNEMQDEVPTPFEANQARDIVEKALGCQIQDVFDEWNDTPCGSASIGQVHKARLKDGTEVAIKIQYPGIEQKFRSDLKNIIRFCSIAMPQHVKPLREIEKQFLTEFDYVLEAKNLSEIAGNIQKDWGHKVVVPKPIPELCRKTVLTMEYLHGVPLRKALRSSLERLAEKENKSVGDLESEFRRKFESLNDDNLVNLDAESRRIGRITQIIQVFDIVYNLPKLIYNYTLGSVLGFPFCVQWTELPLNIADIIQTLLQVHAHEIFLDGVFNGDPHPGNVLLLPDSKLGLIDYGQVKRINEEARLKYAKLILALCHDDKKEILRVWKKEMEQKSKHDDPDIGYLLACFWHDRNTKDVVGPLNMHQFVEMMEAKDPVEVVNEDYVMAARVSILMRGFGNMLGLQLRVAPLWKPYAEEAIHRYEARTTH